ncbi:MAG: S41 family peptidase, partial [Novipirellula sp. JB048]
MNRISLTSVRPTAGYRFSLVAAALLLCHPSSLAAQVATVADATASLPTQQANAEPQADAERRANLERQAIERGLELEQNRQWAEAVRHYEDASRAHPTSKSVYQRLTIAKLHYDVNRRFKDASYLDSLQRLSGEQALDLYAEVLANLQTHYVDHVDWARVMLHGTAALEVALSEAKFIEQTLPHASPQAIERFRQNVHHQLAHRSTATR